MAHSSDDFAQFQTLVEFAPDSIVVHRDLRILYINPAGARLLAAPTTEELLGRHLLDFTVPEYHEMVLERQRALDRPGARVPLVRQRLRRIDGTDVDIDVASAAFTYGGEPAVITIARDVTEQRRLEAELRQAQKMEAVGQLTGGLAHDFKNILSIILTTAEFLRDSLPEERGDLLAGVEDMSSAARRGAEMIRHLMAFSRKADLQLEPVDLGGLLAGTHALLKRVMPENVVVEFESAGEVPPVRADTTAVEQVVLNLATNARDAMPGGGRLRLRVDALEVTEPLPVTAGTLGPGRYARVTVADTGTGMDERTSARVFEPFFTTKPAGHGTGLGLAMVHGLVTQLGGAIAVESEPGRGTTMSIHFPALPERETRRRPSTMSAAPAEKPPGGTERILVVEDEPALRRSSERMLKRLGYEVELAEDGEAALEVLRQRDGGFALVISDTMMPRVDGFELYREVQRSWPALKFLFASGYQAADLAQQGGIPEDAPFISKPWTLAEYARAVRSTLDGPSGEEPA